MPIFCHSELSNAGPDKHAAGESNPPPQHMIAEPKQKVTLRTFECYLLADEGLTWHYK